MRPRAANVHQTDLGTFTTVSASGQTHAHIARSGCLPRRSGRAQRQPSRDDGRRPVGEIGPQSRCRLCVATARHARPCRDKRQPRPPIGRSYLRPLGADGKNCLKRAAMVEWLNIQWAIVSSRHQAAPFSLRYRRISVFVELSCSSFGSVALSSSGMIRWASALPSSTPH